MSSSTIRIVNDGRSSWDKLIFSSSKKPANNRGIYARLGTTGQHVSFSAKAKQAEINHETETFKCLKLTLFASVERIIPRISF